MWGIINTLGISSTLKEVVPARAGRINLDVTWTTGHATGVGFGKYDILYRSHTILVE